MWPRILRAWLGINDPQRGTCGTYGRRRTRRSINQLVPRLELLEDRTVLNGVMWTGNAGDSLWSTPGNWSGDAVPGPMDDVTILNGGGSTAITISGTGANVASVTSSIPIDLVGTTLQTNGGGTVLTGGVNLSGGATLTISSGGDLILNLNDQTLTSFDGTGAIVFGDTNVANAISANGVNVTIDSTLAIHGQDGQLNGLGSFINNGTITAENGGDIALVASLTSVANNGTIEANNGSTIDLQADITGTGTLTTDTGTGSQLTQDGAIIASNTIAGALIYTSSTQNFLTGVTIASSGSLTGALGGGQELDSGDLTLHGTINVDNGSTFGFGASLNETDQINGNGSIVFDSNPSNLLALENGVALTIGLGISVTGENGTIGPLSGGTDTLDNEGIISENAATPGLIVLNINTTNNNTIEALGGGRLELESCTVTGNGTITTDSNAASNVLQNGSEIDTNRIFGTLIYSSGGNVLVGVTIANTGVVTGTASTESISGNLTLNGQIQIDGGSSVGFGINPNENDTISGNGSILFDAGPGNTLALNNNVALTIGSGITVGGQNGTIGTPFAGAVGALTNDGTISVPAGATISVTGGFTNFDGVATLTGGTYNVAGTFEFPGANISNNAADITLSGAASAILDSNTSNDALAPLANNLTAGSLTLAAGRTLTTAGDLTNAGAITVDVTGGASSLTVTGAYTQTAGTTTLLAGGTLTSTTAAINIQGGSLAGTGTVSGNVTVGGAISPGTATAAGLLTVSGNLTMQSSAALVVKLTGPNTTNPVAGADYDQLSASGAITLDSPTLGVGRFVGYVPATGAAFTIIRNTGGASIAGGFAGLSEGSTFNLVGVTARITYLGGAGHDVQLTTPAPTTVYVDATWAGTAIGSDPSSDPIGGLVFGYNAFADIGAAIAQVAANGTVTVYGGTYSAALDVSKPLQAIRTALNPHDVPPQMQVTLSGAVTLGTDTTFTMNAVGLTFGSTVNDDTAGSDTLTINGGGTVTFTGAVGGSKVLKAINDQASTDLNRDITTTGAQTYASNTTLGANISLTSTSAGAISLASLDGADSLTVNTAGTTSFTATVGGQTPLASLTTDAAGTTTISASITTSGAQTYNNSITLGFSTVLTAQTGTITLAGATLSLGTSSITIDNTDASSAITSQITGSGSVTKTGTGTLTLTDAANSYTGTTTVQGGILSIRSDGDLGAAPGIATANAVTLANAAVLQLAGGASTVTLNGNRGITLSIGGGTIDTENETLDVAGNITGNTSLTKTGAGDLALAPLAGSNVPGTITVSAGRLLFGSQAALGTGAVNVASGATLDYIGAAILTPANTITFASGAAVAAESAQLVLPASTALPTAGTIIFNRDSVATAAITVLANVATTGTLTVQVGGQNSSVGLVDWTGAISGTGGLVKTQSGTLILAGINAFRTGTTVNGGTLTVSADTNLGDPANGVTINAGTLEVATGFSTARSLTLGDPAATVQVDPAQTLTLTSAVGGSGSLTVTGGGTLDLSGLTDTFGGSGQSVTITASTLRVSSDAGLGDAANTVTLTAGGTLQASGTFVTGRNITLGAGGGTLDTNGNNLTLESPGVVGGSGSLTKIGAGTLTLTSTNSYAGGTVLSSGTLDIGGDANLGQTTGGLTIGAATLEVAGTFTTARGITLDDGSTIQVNSGDALALSTGIIGSGSLTKTGSGSLTLGGANTYTGATSVSGGTLLVDGSLASTDATTVDAGATLGGNGSLAGSVVVNAGGTVNPGTSTTVGKLTIAGNYTQSAGSTLAIKLAGATTPGTDYDALAVSGTAILAGTIQTTAINGFQPSGGDTYHILTAAPVSGDFSTRSGFVFGSVFLVEQSGSGSLDLLAVANPIIVNNATDTHVADEISLREAVRYADAGSQLGVPVTINFAPGLSGATILLTQSSTLGGLEVGPGGAGAGAITIDGSSLAQPVTIDGDGILVLQVDGGTTLNLTGVTITSGASTVGGAVLNDGTLVATNVAFTGNTATSAGGAIASAGALTVTGSTFTGNTVTGAFSAGGGAIAIEGGTATITGNDFVNNQVASGAGGAIVTFFPATIQFNRFSGNGDAVSGQGNAVAVIGSVQAVPDDSWWASNAGPAAGDVVSEILGVFASLPVNDYLVLSAAANPDPILNAQSTTVTASFTTDSAGHTIAASDLGVLIGQAITFGGNSLPGTALTGAQASIQSSGQATVTYNAGPHGGLDAVNVTVDGVTATAGITVNEPAKINSAASTTFTVGRSGSFTLSAFGFPSPTLTEAGTLPGGVGFNPGAGGTATLTGTPNAGTGGTYTLAITAHNGIGSDDQQTFTLTVDEAPSITSANAATFTAGSAGSFTITTGHDFPTTTTLSESGTLPSGVTFQDNHDGTATLSGIPTAGSGNRYALTITAHNGIDPDAQQTFALTVDEPPTITSGNATTFTVGQASTFTITTGPDFPAATTLTEIGGLPGGVTFQDNHDGTATLAGTPTAGSGNRYALTITAHNGVNPDAQQTFALTVDEPPSFTSGNAATFTAGAAGSFTISTGHDFPAATTVTESGALPAGVTFHDNHDGTATLTGTPAAGSGNTYPLTITAHNGISPDAQQNFTLTVNELPSFTSAPGATFNVNVPTTFTVTVLGFSQPTLTATFVPTGATLSGTSTLDGISFVDRHNGTAILSGTALPSTGAYVLAVNADQTNSPFGHATQLFTLTVTAPPTISPPTIGPFTVGTSNSFGITAATGPMLPTVSLTESGKLPASLSFVGRAGTTAHPATATLAGKPAPNTGGTYPITLTASNGPFNTTQTVTFVVDQAPAITSPGSITPVTLAASPNSSYVITATGFPVPSFSMPPIQGVTLVDNHNGTATLIAPTAAATTTPEMVTITAGNGIGNNASHVFKLTVVQPPTIRLSPNGSPTFTVPSGSTAPTQPTLTITAQAGVPAGPLAIREVGKLPAGIVLKAGAAGTATLTGTPGKNTGGTYPVTFAVGTGVAVATQTMTLVVDQAPAITNPGTVTPVTLAASPNSSYVVTATGFLPPSFSMPAIQGVTLVDNHNGTATLIAPTAAATTTPEMVTITAGNGIGNNASHVFKLTVVQPPTIRLSPNGSPTFTVPSGLTAPTQPTLTITAQAGVPAGPLAIREIGKLPAGIVLKAGAAGTATLTGTPGKNTGGTYPVTFAVGTGAAVATQTLTLTVDQAPAIITGKSATFALGQGGSFLVKTSGFPLPSFTISSISPSTTGISLTDNLNGTATLTAPGAAPGAYTVSIKAGNAAGSYTQAFTLMILQPPTFLNAPINQTVAVGAVASFALSATGSAPVTLTAAGLLPRGLTFVAPKVPDGTATVQGTVAATVAPGSYTLVITARNGVLPAALQLFTLKVQ